MNSYERSIFSAVSEGNMREAKKWLKQYSEYRIANSKTDKGWFERFASTLDKNTSVLIELPMNLKGMLVVEDPSLSLISKRYVPSQSDLDVLTKLENTFRVRDKLQDLAINYVNGAIFHGESGCGKTSLGRYLAARLNLPFAYLDFAEAINSYMGKTAENIKRAFEFIKGRPCVFMIDEIDAIGGERKSEGGVQGELNRVVITLMQQLDLFGNDSILLFATNRIDILDKALLRRIPIHYEMSPMDDERRIKMVEAYLNTIPEASYDRAGIKSFLANFSPEESNAVIMTSLIQWIVSRLAEGLPVSMCSEKPVEMSLFD